MGLLEDLLNNPVVKEGVAQRELEKQGSVMAKEKFKVGKLGIAGDVISELLNLINPIEFMGGTSGGALAHVPGTFRGIGLKRQAGALSPEMYAEALQSQPNYQRYKQLVENMIRKTLGGEFKAYRGTSAIDPLIDDPLLRDILPKATAGSLDPGIAETFSRFTAGQHKVPSHIAKFTATPESVLGLTPKRGSSYAGEAELLLDPAKLKEIVLKGKVPVDPKASLLSNEPLEAADPLIQQMLRDILGRVASEGR